MLKELWASLGRAEVSITDQVAVSEQEEGSYYMAIQLCEKMPPSVVAAMRSYIRAYARECGWSTSKMHINSRRIQFVLKQKVEDAGHKRIEKGGNNAPSTKDGSHRILK